MIQVTLKDVAITLHQLRIRKIIINPQLGELTGSMLNNTVLLHQTRSLKILANAGWNKWECLAKSLFLLVALFASTKAFSSGWTENWLGHIGDWAYMYVSHPDYDNRCVGKRTSGSTHYELSLSENSSNWDLRIAGIDSYPISPSGRYRLHLALDGKYVNVLDATVGADNSLIAANLPGQLIKTIAASSRLSVQVEDHLIEDFPLKRMGSLIDALNDCQHDRRKPSARSNGPPELYQEKVQLRFMKPQEKELKEKRLHHQAIEVSKQILTIDKKNPNANDHEMAERLQNLADIYLSTNQDARAEAAYKDAIALKEKALGSEHPELASILNELGMLYHNYGRYSEAESLFKRSLTLREKNWGLST